MSLDLYVGKNREIHYNVTHNLAVMARAVQANNGLNLYNLLWEAEDRKYRGKDIADSLIQCYQELYLNEFLYKQYNAENGWGDTQWLIQFLDRVMLACLANPNKRIYCSR